MKIEVILFLLMPILTLAFKMASYDMTKPIIQNELRKPFSMKTPEERRKLKLFPKNSSKYIVNPDPHPKKIDDVNVNRKNLHKNTRSKNIVTSTETALNVKPKTTRAPLMKPRRFSITPLTVIKTQPTEHYRNDSHESKSVTTVHELEREHVEDDVSEPEKIEDLNAEPSVINLTVIDSDLNGVNKQDTSKEIGDASKIIDREEMNKEEHLFSTTFSDRSSLLESVEDQTEFMLVNYEKQNKEDLGSSGDGDFGLNEDTNALDDSENSFLKHKRDVIEEENLGSTVSGFKFTGRESRLINRATFRNVNE